MSELMIKTVCVCVFTVSRIMRTKPEITQIIKSEAIFSFLTGSRGKGSIWACIVVVRVEVTVWGLDCDCQRPQSTQPQTVWQMVPQHLVPHHQAQGQPFYLMSYVLDSLFFF